MDHLKTSVYRLLKRSEGYFKTDMIYLARGGFWLTFGQVFVSFLAFLLAIAYANLLPKEAFGVYKYVLSVGGMLGALTLTGLGTSLVRSVSRGHEESLTKVFWIQLKWGLWITVASLAGCFYYAYNGNDILAIALLIVGIFSPISQSAGLYLSFLNGKRDFKRKSIYDIFYNLIPAVSIFSSLLFTDNPLILVFVYFSSYTIAALLFFILTKIKYSNSETETVSPETITYGKHLSLMNMLNIVVSQIDKVLVFHYLGGIQLAVYTFAMSPVSQLTSFLRSANVLSLPKFSNNTKSEVKRTLPQKLSLLSLPLVVAVLSYIIIAPYVYKILFPQYMDAVIYSQYYVLILLFFPQEFLRTAMVAHATEKTLYISTASNLLVRIICLFALLPTFGIAGGIGALLLSNGINGIIAHHLFKKM